MNLESIAERLLGKLHATRIEASVDWHREVQPFGLATTEETPEEFKASGGKWKNIHATKWTDDPADSYDPAAGAIIQQIIDTACKDMYRPKLTPVHNGTPDVTHTGEPHEFTDGTFAFWLTEAVPEGIRVDFFLK